MRHETSTLIGNSGYEDEDENDTCSMTDMPRGKENVHNLYLTCDAKDEDPSSTSLERKFT
jgi:hypothetical protein